MDMSFIIKFGLWKYNAPRDTGLSLTDTLIGELFETNRYRKSKPIDRNRKINFANKSSIIWVSYKWTRLGRQAFNNLELSIGGKVVKS